MEAIENIGRKCTVVIIAHRLSTVMRADNIYEFADGTIKAFGNFIELQNKSETFKQLIRYESGISIKEDKIF